MQPLWVSLGDDDEALYEDETDFIPVCDEDGARMIRDGEEWVCPVCGEKLEEDYN